MSKRIALYLRVSTSEQTTANQLCDLNAWASARGYLVAGIYEDAGISGANGRDKRPQFDRLLKAAARREFDIVAAWSVDRLGRSLQSLVETLAELSAINVDLYLHQQALDTTTPSGRAMFGMLSVFSQFEREMIVERVRCGMVRARREGTRSGRAIGRPPMRADSIALVRSLLLQGATVRSVATQTNVSVGSVATVRRTLRDSGLLTATASR